MVNMRVGKDGKLAGYWSAAEVRDAAPVGKRNGAVDYKAPETAASA